MNWVEVRNDWKGLKAVVQSFWPALSQVDLALIDGCRDDLVILLRSRYGLSEKEAVDDIRRFEKDVRFPGAVK